MNGLNDEQRCYKQTYKQTYRITNMKTKIISKILLTLALAFVLGSAITHVHGATQGSSPSLIGPPDQQFPLVTIHSTENVDTRGKMSSFVLSRLSPPILLMTPG